MRVKAKTTKSICRPLANQGFTKDEMNKFPHLIGLDLADEYESKDKKHIDILIGGDYFYTFVGDKIIRGTSGPVAVQTSFGFTLSGGMPPLKIRSRAHLNLMITCLKTASATDSLESRLMKFWTCEGLGVEKDCVDTVDAQIDESIVFKDGKYYIDLPKREDESLAGDTFQNASNRLRSLERRFKKHPDFEKVYTAALGEKISLGS